MISSGESSAEIVAWSCLFVGVVLLVAGAEATADDDSAAATAPAKAAEATSTLEEIGGSLVLST